MCVENTTQPLRITIPVVIGKRMEPSVSSIPMRERVAMSGLFLTFIEYSRSDQSVRLVDTLSKWHTVCLVESLAFLAANPSVVFFLRPAV